MQGKGTCVVTNNETLAKEVKAGKVLQDGLSQ